MGISFSEEECILAKTSLNAESLHCLAQGLQVCALNKGEILSGIGLKYLDYASKKFLNFKYKPDI